MGEVVKLVPLDYSSPNFDKYRTTNPLKRWVIERYLKHLVELIGKEDPQSILSVGCGEGVILYFLQKSNKDLKIVGIDLDDDALNIARLLINGEFRVGDARELPTGDSLFDVSICASVFEHIEEGHRQIIREMKRVSKKSIITIPHPLLFRLSRLFTLKNWSTLGREQEHVKEFGKNELQSILPKNSKIERRSFWHIAEF